MFVILCHFRSAVRIFGQAGSGGRVEVAWCYQWRVAAAAESVAALFRSQFPDTAYRVVPLAEGLRAVGAA